MKKYALTLTVLASFILAGCGRIDSYLDTSEQSSEGTTAIVVQGTSGEEKTEETSASEETSTKEKATSSANSASTAEEKITAEANGTSGSNNSTEQVTADNGESSAETPVTVNIPPELECVSDPKKPEDQTPDCPNMADKMIYSKYSSYMDMCYIDLVPPMGGYYADPELESAMQEHPDGLFAIRIDVYSEDKASRKEAFLAGYSDGSMTYNELISQMNALEAERIDLKNTFALSDMTEEGFAEYEAKAAEIDRKLEALDKKKRDMMYAAEQNYLTEEAARLASCGIIVSGISHNAGYTNYVRAAATADQIRNMPFSGTVGYLIYLDCK